MNYKQRLYGNAINGGYDQKETYYTTSDNQYDYVYYNIDLNNFPKLDPVNNNVIEEEDIPISIKVNRVSDILKNDTKDWEVGVQSYSIPNSLPIFVSKTVNILDDGNNYEGDPLYYIIIKNTATDEEYKEYLDFEALNDDTDIYEYSEIIRVMNGTIEAIFDTYTLPEPTPFFKINNDTTKYEYWAPPLFTGPGPAYRMKLSYSTYKLFSCFEYSLSSSDFVIYSTPNKGNQLIQYNGVDYSVYYEQWDPKPGQSGFRRIIFKTSIPIVNELTGNIQQTSENILIDRLITDRIANVCTALNYNPESNVIFHNMHSSEQFRQFTVDVFSERKNGIVDKYMLNPSDSFFLKIIFRRPKINN